MLTNLTTPGFEQSDFGNDCIVWTGRLPGRLQFSNRAFDKLWQLHPPEFHTIQMYGRLVKTPRWQQAYGQDYYYTGQTNRARPIPEELLPLQEWACGTVHKELNGLLLNWYDASLRHYIGRHRDSTANMIDDAPIVVVSLGATRIFRMRAYRGSKYHDFCVRNGSVIVFSQRTNRFWTHEVPHLKKYHGRRISVTLRAFELDCTRS